MPKREKTTMENEVVEVLLSARTAHHSLNIFDYKGIDVCLRCAVKHARKALQLLHARQRRKRAMLRAEKGGAK